MKLSLHYDYIAVGHVTIDLLPDGSRAPGGTALYSALQAARLGCRSLVFTTGLSSELRELLAPYLDELDVHIAPAARTTTFETRWSGDTRSQRLLAWAGPIDGRQAPSGAILHLAPVARELPASWEGDSPFRGLTAQGLVRQWSASSAEVILAAPDADAVALAANCDAVVVSAQEREACAPLLERATAGGALVAITDGPRASVIVLPSGERLQAPVTALSDPIEDLGAGDVYAAALFVELADGQAPERAGAFANAAAGLRMRGKGARAVADRPAIERALNAT